MSSILEIESAIQKLPEPDFWKLSAWFDEIRAKAWDGKIESDAKSGKLNFLFQEAESERPYLKPWPKEN